MRSLNHNMQNAALEFAFACRHRATRFFGGPLAMSAHLQTSIRNPKSSKVYAGLCAVSTANANQEV